MGGGTSRTADAPKAAPFDIRGAVREGEGSEGGTEESAFCARTHAVAFRSDGTATVEVGMVATLGLGRPPVVIIGATEIGEVTDAADAMRGCLALGYTMSGVVHAFDPNAREGELTISGRRRDGG